MKGITNWRGKKVGRILKAAAREMTSMKKIVVEVVVL